MNLDDRFEESVKLIASLEEKGMNAKEAMSFLNATYSMVCAMNDMPPEKFSELQKLIADKYPIMYSGLQLLRDDLKKKD